MRYLVLFLLPRPSNQQCCVQSFAYPSNLASPLSIIVEASNGASDYGNKFGEPVVAGFSRSFGMRLPSGERREWIKPIMFTAGIGMMDGRHVDKANMSRSLEALSACPVAMSAFINAPEPTKYPSRKATHAMHNQTRK